MERSRQELQEEETCKLRMRRLITRHLKRLIRIVRRTIDDYADENDQGVVEILRAEEERLNAEISMDHHELLTMSSDNLVMYAVGKH